MPEKRMMRRRHIKNLRRRRGSQVSGSTPSHHPISHHKEPILRDVARKAAEQSHHHNIAEKTVFNAELAENEMMAKAKAVNNMIATVQVGIESGFQFQPLYNNGHSEPQSQPEHHQLSPVVDVFGKHFAIIGKYEKDEPVNKIAHIRIQSASLVAVQNKQEGIAIIEPILSIDFSQEIFLGNLNQIAEPQHLRLSGEILQNMHDQLLRQSTTSH
ncbi:MAG: hypothetical protein RLZZ455_234 [Candidatus Parcubacteria bacterium]|jgi:hypothetical protein